MWAVSCWKFVLFFKQKTADEIRISDWSSDVCSSDLHDLRLAPGAGRRVGDRPEGAGDAPRDRADHDRGADARRTIGGRIREEPLSDPPPDRKTRDRRAGAGFLHLLAVVPLAHLDRKSTRLHSSN